MTRLEILTRAMSRIFGKEESDLLAWADMNMEPKVREKLSEEVDDTEAAKLLAEVERDPRGVAGTLFSHLFRGRMN